MKALRRWRRRAGGRRAKADSLCGGRPEGGSVRVWSKHIFYNFFAPSKVERLGTILEEFGAADGSNGGSTRPASRRPAANPRRSGHVRQRTSSPCLSKTRSHFSGAPGASGSARGRFWQNMPSLVLRDRRVSAPAPIAGEASSRAQSGLLRAWSCGPAPARPSWVVPTARSHRAQAARLGAASTPPLGALRLRRAHASKL